jgi:hypothetical protein
MGSTSSRADTCSYDYSCGGSSQCAIAMGGSSGTKSQSGISKEFCESARTSAIPYGSTPCKCTPDGGTAASPAGNAKSTGNPVGDVLDFGANMWILQNIKNPYTAVFAQNFTQGFLTSFFANNAEAQRQREMFDAAVRQQQERLAEQAALEQRRQQDLMFARLNSELKLSGNSTDLAFKTSGESSGDPAMKLSGTNDAPAQFKLGDSSNQGFGIAGLPGINVGGPANGDPTASTDASGGLQMKLGDSAAQPAGEGIAGLPGINLGQVEPAQAAAVADAATNLSGPERVTAEDAALQAAAKNPALAAASDDPFVSDFQTADQQYAAAAKTQQDALQAASEAQGHAQADQTALSYAQKQLPSSNATEAQTQAYQQMVNAAQTDEQASETARAIFEDANARLTIARDRATDSLASFAPPAAAPPTPFSTSGGTQRAAAIPAASPRYSSAVLDLTHVNSQAPAILATPERVGHPVVESVAACLSRIGGSSAGAGSALSLDQLQKRLDADRLAYDRIAATAKNENADRNDWLDDMRKAAQDAGTNALDKGVDGLFKSTHEGLQDAEIELHGEIQAVNEEAKQLRQEMADARQAVDAAKGDPAELAHLNAQWSDLQNNQIQPLLQKRRELESQWANYFKWNERVDSFNSARDFGEWITDTNMPCQKTNGKMSCGQNNPIEASKNLDLSNVQAEDINPSLDGLKQVMKFAAHNADLLTYFSRAASIADIAAHATFIGETWDATSATIDIGYDLTVGYLGLQRLRQISQNNAAFQRAQSMLGERIDRTNAEIACYSKAR